MKKKRKTKPEIRKAKPEAKVRTATKSESKVRPAIKDVAKVSAFPKMTDARLEEFRKKEKMIIEKLNTGKNKELFLKNPAIFFKKNKIAISPGSMRLMERYKGFEQFIPTEGFLLPNGKRITPNVRINITTKK